MTEEKKETELSPEEQALGAPETHTAGMPEEAIEGESVARDPRETPRSPRKGANIPADDEQQVLEEAADEGVEQAADDQRFAAD